MVQKAAAVAPGAVVSFCSVFWVNMSIGYQPHCSFRFGVVVVSEFRGRLKSSCAWNRRRLKNARSREGSKTKNLQLKRKPQAYLDYQESTGVPKERGAIVHQGGQSWPLFTPATCEPESSEEGEPDRTEYSQDPLTYPSKPFSHATSEVTQAQDILFF